MSTGDEAVGPYRIVRAIGAGGTARIDLALVERAYGFRRQVVLKRPLEHLRGDPAVGRSLRREAIIGGRLRHPNLVGVLDAGTHEGYDYLALEYIDGASLRTVMQGAQPSDVRLVPLPVALSIVVSVARGLHEAHELTGADGAPLGLVHRDVSPGNILLARDGAVKLADFGIAKDTRIETLSGSLRGTVTYMAPEQCRGHAFDRRADVFSLGVILHELITGQRLFGAENDVASLHKVLSAPIPDPREITTRVSSELAAITLRALARDPAQRVATARELADRLDAFAAREGLVLGARQVSPVADAIARGDEAALARMSQPRFTATHTAVMVIDSAVWDAVAAPEDEPSLVALIERTPEPELITPTFDPPPPPAAPRPPPPRRIGLVVVLSAMLLGIAGGAFLALRSAPRRGAAPPGPPDAAPVVVVVPDAALVDAPILADAPADAPHDAPVEEAADAPADGPTDGPADEPPDAATEEPGDEIVFEPDDLRAPARRKGMRRPAREDTPPDAQPPPPPRPRVEWDPALLLPGDKKK